MNKSFYSTLVLFISKLDNLELELFPEIMPPKHRGRPKRVDPEQQIDGEVDGVLAEETPVEVDQPGCGRGKGHGQKKTSEPLEDDDEPQIKGITIR